MPVHEVVKVDYFINGCPVYIPEVIAVVKCLLMAKPYVVPNYPVCVECKMNENVCRYEGSGVFRPGNLGPGVIPGASITATNATAAGGLVDNPAVSGQKDILAKYGLKLEDILGQFTLYNDSMGEKYDPDFK